MEILGSLTVVLFFSLHMWKSAPLKSRDGFSAKIKSGVKMSAPGGETGWAVLGIILALCRGCIVSALCSGTQMTPELPLMERHWHFLKVVQPISNQAPTQGIQTGCLHFCMAVSYPWVIALPLTGCADHSQKPRRFFSLKSGSAQTSVLIHLQLQKQWANNVIGIV